MMEIIYGFIAFLIIYSWLSSYRDHRSYKKWEKDFNSKSFEEKFPDTQNLEDE